MAVARTTVEQRKGMPLASGVLDYFPDALLVVAEVSRVGNEQHHPGEPLHWDKSKSTDEADALMRHLIDRGTVDTDGLRHTAKVAWRALALLQRELDAEAAERRAGWRVEVVQPFETDEVNKISAYIDQLARQPLSPVLYRGPEREQTMDEFMADFRGMPVPEWEAYGPKGSRVDVTNRGEWPPDTRVGGLLTCCGASEHTLGCPQYR